VIPETFAPFEHEEARAQDFVSHGDDGALVAAANQKGWELELQARSSPTSGMDFLPANLKFAEKAKRGFAFFEESAWKHRSVFPALSPRNCRLCR
jgi:hypothetical protein